MLEYVYESIINNLFILIYRCDPTRWDGIPITFETKWIDPDNSIFDVRTSIMIHDALEKEFNIDIMDKNILIGSVKQAVGFVIDNHNAI